MDKLQELLTITMEECGELIQACSKAIRCDDYRDNKKLIQEIADVYCMIELIHEYDLVSWDEIDKGVLKKIERLKKEMMLNVSLSVSETKRPEVFEVRGRGELQMAILIETMRREGFEFMVSKPEVITIVENNTLLEPTEKVFIDVDENHVGVVTEKLSKRKGKMLNLQNNGFGRVSLEFIIPSRGMIGFRSEFLTDTKGSGILNSLFDSYAPWFGPIPQRNSGVIIADRPGKVTQYASQAMADRGELFSDIGTEVYLSLIHI